MNRYKSFTIDTANYTADAINHKLQDILNYFEKNNYKFLASHRITDTYFTIIGETIEKPEQKNEGE